MNTKSKLRPLLEIIIELFFIFFYIWYLEVNASEWVRGTFFWILCVGFPLLCIWLEQRTFPEFNLGFDSFRDCFRGILWFTLGGTAFLIFLSLYFKNFNYDGIFLTRVCEYFFWAFLQQVGFQIFLTRRAEKCFSNQYYAALFSSTLFASLHAPNLSLVFFSWVGGFFWALIFLRTPNLYMISVSHGWLAVVALYCVPIKWLHGLRIGPGYWNF